MMGTSAGGAPEAPADEAVFADIFEAAPYGMGLLHGPSSLVVLANRALLDLIGRPREEVLGRSLTELGFLDHEYRPGATFRVALPVAAS